MRLSVAAVVVDLSIALNVRNSSLLLQTNAQQLTSAARDKRTATHVCCYRLTQQFTSAATDKHTAAHVCSYRQTHNNSRLLLLQTNTQQLASAATDKHTTICVCCYQQTHSNSHLLLQTNTQQFTSAATDKHTATRVCYPHQIDHCISPAFDCAVAGARVRI